MATAKPNVQYLPVDEIEPSPDNPRTAFDGDLGDLTELTELIRAQGVLQPLLVCPKRDGRYPLVFGERRLASAKLAGLAEAAAAVGACGGSAVGSLAGRCRSGSVHT